MQLQKRKRVTSDIKLLDVLLDYKLNSEEFMNNEKVVETISSVVDDLKGRNKGYILFSAAHRLDRRLILVSCQEGSYYIYTWKSREQIEKPFEATIHEKNLKFDLQSWIDTHVYDSNCNRDELVQAMLTESLSGFSINRNKGEDFLEFCAMDGIQEEGPSVAALMEDPLLSDLIKLGRTFSATMFHSAKDMSDKIKKYTERLSCEDLRLRISTADNLYAKKVFLGKIINVRTVGDRRYYHVKYLRYRRNTAGNLLFGNVIGACTAGTTSKDLNLRPLGKCYLAESRDSCYYDQYDASYLKRIPYNIIDEGRLLVGIQVSSHNWKLIIGPDPRVDEDSENRLKSDITHFLEDHSKKSVSLNETFIESKDGDVTCYLAFENQIKRENQNISHLALKMKSLKRMVDEYNYLIKKKAAAGSDVFITDKIKYNHEEGKIAYNDFSISVDDELIKARLFQNFNDYLVMFYRGDRDEQSILDELLDTTFQTIDQRLQARHKSDFDINMKINDKIDISIKGKISKNRSLLLYLNDQRFKKNELLEVVKEITCYREQEEADRFISNIGKLGLSVYIGITTGYEVTYPKVNPRDDDEVPIRRIFKFRKLKGRSNYELILDKTHIPIKGKALINILYQRFNNEYVNHFFEKVDKIIFQTCNTSLNYLKYKFLIDASYDAFKNRAKEFLDKKVEDTGSEYVRYFNKKSRKKMDGVKVQGTSGNIYVIAFDNSNSFVFVDPVKSEKQPQDLDVDLYEDGKYICMIDQSNIKSNIGYDTVVSKLMALKNDSSVASTIYNLEEELNG